MSLPRLIEILPVTGPLNAEVVVPGSKSMTNRALIIAAQAVGYTTIRGALWSDDTQVMVECLQKLGIGIETFEDETVPSNRTFRVLGWGGKVPVREAELYVGNAGTTARFITAFCALSEGSYRIYGTPRMHQRPMEQLFRILSGWGIQFEFEEQAGHLPIRMSVPKELQMPSTVTVDLSKSSQFASALELIRPHFGFTIQPEGFDDDGYYQLTKAMARKPSSEITIEPDASSATYFWAAASLFPGSDVRIKNWPSTSLQLDSKFAEMVKFKPMKLSRRTDLGDSVMMAAVLGSLWPRGFSVTDAGRLREQETDRLAALEKELNKCGGKVKAWPTWLEISAVPELHGAEIETYDDHRMAMAFSILGLKVPGMVIRNAQCVTKTLPNFYELLEDMVRQSGHGPVVIDAKTRKPVL